MKHRLHNSLIFIYGCLSYYNLTAADKMIAAQAAPLALYEAIENSLAHNRSLKNLQIEVEQRLYGLEETRSEFMTELFPRGDFQEQENSSQYSYGAELSKKFKTGQRFGVEALQSNASFSDSPNAYNTRLRVALTQPLFRNSGKLVNSEALTQAKHNIKTSLRALEDAKAHTVISVVRNYENILRLEQSIALETESFTRIDQLLKTTIKKEELGRSTKVERLRVELQHGQSFSRLQNFTEQLHSARQEFSDLLGNEKERRYTLSPAPLLEIEPVSQKEAVRIAHANRLDLAQLEQDIRDIKRGVKISEKRIWPDLQLTAGHEWQNEDAADANISAASEGNWFVGLTTNSGLFNRKARAQAKSEALSLDAAVLNLSILKYQVNRSVKDALNSYHRAQQDMLISEKNALLAKERIMLAQRFYHLGRGSHFDVTDAEEAYSLATSEHLTRRAEAAIQGYSLMQTLGILVEVPAALKPGGHHEKG